MLYADVYDNSVVKNTRNPNFNASRNSYTFFIGATINETMFLEKLFFFSSTVAVMHVWISEFVKKKIVLSSKEINIQLNWENKPNQPIDSISFDFVSRSPSRETCLLETWVTLAITFFCVITDPCWSSQ